MDIPCVILAGGLGTRMRPATEHLPKALIRVHGQPFADLQLKWLRRQGVTHVVYSIGFLGEMLHDHVGDGSRFGLRVDYVDEGADLRGTGGALRLVVDSGLVDDALVVLNGDSYLDVDLPDAARRFREGGFPVLMTVLRNQDRWDRSNAVVRDGMVIIYDKRRPVEHRDEMLWIDYGLSVIRADVIRQRIPSGNVADIADIIRDLSSAGLVAAYEVSRRFYEIGSPQGLADLEAHLAAGG